MYPVNRRRISTVSDRLGASRPESIKKTDRPGKPVRIKVIKAQKKADYKIPKTPKNSGIGWGP